MELEQGELENPTQQFNVRLPLDLINRLDRHSKQHYRAKSKTTEYLLDLALRQEGF